MRIEAAVMAEGLAQDADGAISAVRIGQNVFTPDSLPAQTKRAFLVLLVEDEEGEDLTGVSLELNFSFVDPSGDVQSAQAVPFEISGRRFEDLRMASWFPFEAPLMIREYGTHRMVVTFRMNNQVMGSKDLNLHVLDRSLARTTAT